LDVATFSSDLPAAVDRVLAGRQKMSAAALDRVAGRTWEGVCGELRGHYSAVLADQRRTERSGGVRPGAWARWR
ncbi:alpha-mannosyltransferase, partial [Corynebacterium marambiense]